MREHVFPSRPAPIVAAFLLLLGCPADDDDATTPPPDPEPVPFVTIAGTHSLALPGELTLVASTTDGTDSAYTWTSSDESVATVVGGLVVAVAYGESVITATGADTGASDTHGVVVVPEIVVPDVTVTVSGAFYVQVGDEATLAAVTANAVDSGYLWESSDAAVATVDGGVVQTHTIGAVTITATGTDSGASGTLGIVVAEEIPHLDEWAASPHADRTAEAFVHWDEEDPPEVPVDCARCHSTPGYLDWIGADGSAANSVEAAAPIGSTVECAACHNPVTATMDAVLFPSGVELTGLGDESRCMQCHQGRSSADDVDEAIATAAVGDDEVAASLGFVNIHYYPAAATLNGGRTRGGYQYEDRLYDVRFRHVPEVDTCIGCHDSHTLAVKVDVCQTCHEDVTDAESAKDIRMISSLATDYDGDADLAEGVYHEMMGVAGELLAAMQAYAAVQGNPAICYSAAAYPYFFVDTDGSGVCEEGEATYANKYASWTPRLLRAAYNYQLAQKDPGAFAHNAKYVIELLFDGIEDLGGDVSGLARTEGGHFDGSGMPARDWDSDDEVSASCSPCHGGSEGFRFKLEHGVGAGVEQGNGLDCATCHDTFGEPALPEDEYALVSVESWLTPGEIELTAADPRDNVCMSCHKGREDSNTIDAYIANGSTSFRNVHYLPAGGVLMGSEAELGYQYGANAYSTRRMHPPSSTVEASCTMCHDPVETEHTFDVSDNLATCGNALCHGAIAGVEAIRSPTLHGTDYDGDGDAAEPLAGEVEGLASAVLWSLQEYEATQGSNLGICYTPDAYPYFFKDTDGSGECESGEAVSSNRYPNADWTPQMMYAAHNFQISQKDPGAWAHNFDYMAQVLYDSVEDLLGDPSLTGLTLVRPAP